MIDREQVRSSTSTLTKGIFTYRGRVFSLRDVLGAAECSGIADSFWNRLQDAVACETYAAEEGFESDDGELQTALDSFRYARRLVTVEETERWLVGWELSEGELIDTLAREHWRQRFRDDLGTIREYFAPPPGLLADALWQELVVHDHLLPMSTTLARRVVAPELIATHTGPRSATEGAAGTHEEVAGVSTSLLTGTPERPSRCPEWARCSPDWRSELERLDAAYRDLLGVVLTEPALESALVSRRLDLTWLRLRTARFATADAAREARWCMTVDGEPFEEATGRGATLREDRELFIEDAGDALAPFLVSAVAGDEVLLEDTGEEAGGALLVEVDARTPPRLDHPAVRARLEASIVDRCFGPAIGERIRWLVPIGESQ